MLPIPLPEDSSSTKTHIPFPLLGLHKRINPDPKQMYRLCSKASFDGEELLATRKNHKMEYHPFSAVGDCFFNIFAATLHTGRRFSNDNPRTRHAVVTGTHLSWYGQALGGQQSHLAVENLKLLPHVQGVEYVHLVTHTYVIPRL